MKDKSSTRLRDTLSAAHHNLPVGKLEADPAERVHDMVDTVYRSESRRVLATLIRLVGDFDLAEEALHDAFTAAVQQWPRDGAPTNPRAWLISAGRFKAIDGIRRRARFDASLTVLAEQLDAASRDTMPREDEGVEDDRLRLIFTCCHPALSPEAQVALTLREVCGLKTEEIARAFPPLRPPWPSVSCAPRRKFAMPVFPIRCRHGPISQIGWTPCCRWSTWCSTRATRRPRAYH
jgi:DNA-directed RNA polymerase specialized sigma24 family protein